jgi:hypothetical protein
MSNFRFGTMNVSKFKETLKQLIEENHSSIYINEKTGEIMMNFYIKDLDQPTQGGSDMVLSANSSKDGKEKGENQPAIAWGKVYRKQ